jgi:thiol-disulfide isomerase/thioredoxin
MSDKTEKTEKPETRVEMITASWCGRCKEIKPEVTALCEMTSIPLTFVDYTKMEEEDTASIKSLPTLRTYTKDSVIDHTATTFEDWKTLVKSLAAAAVSTDGTDF